MKKSLFGFIFAAGSMLFASCNQEVLPESVNEKVHISVFTENTATKTYIADMGGGAYQPLWEDGDELGIFLSLTPPNDNTNISPEATLVATATDDGFKAYFEGDVVADNSDKLTIYAAYPASSIKRAYAKSTRIGLDIPVKQTPRVVNGEYSFDPSADILVAKPHTCYVVDGEAVSNEGMKFSRVSSVLKLSFTSNNSSEIYNQKIDSVIFSTAKADIAGRISVDPIGGTFDKVNNRTDSKSIIATPEESAKPTIGSGNNTIFLSVAPVSIDENEVITINIYAGDYTIRKVIEEHPAMQMPMGQIGVINLSLSDENIVNNEGDDYTLDTTDATVAKGKNSNYASSGDVTVAGITWSVTGNATMNPWRIGGNKISGVDREVYTKTAMPNSYAQIDLTLGQMTCTVNSINFIYSANADFSEATTITLTSAAANTKYTFAPKDGFKAEMYYKFVFNLTNTTTSNKFVEFKKVEFKTSAE